MSSPREPYREAPKVARYVCVACYRSVSTMPGPCPNCRVERVSLDREDVRADVRREVALRFEQRLDREEGLCIGGGFVTGVVAFALIAGIGGALLLEPLWVFTMAWMLGLLAGIGGARAARRLLVQLDPRSALANRDRMQRGLQAPLHEEARMNGLLRLLGGRIDG